MVPPFTPEDTRLAARETAYLLTFAAHRRTLVLLALNAHGHGEFGWGDPRHWIVDAA